MDKEPEMLFSSLEFLFRFLPIFLVIYKFTPQKFKNLVLLIGSVAFYALGEPVYVFLILASILVNFFGAYRLHDLDDSIRRKGLFFFLMFADLGVLFVFKYFDFFAQIVNSITGRGWVPQLQLTLPLGISFYTFQMISVVVDIYTRKLEKRVYLIEFATYICMFPQLIAGPIVQYQEVACELRRRTFSLAQVERGLCLFTLGLGSKVLLANKISIFWNQVQGIGFANLSTPVAWLGALAFSFQIYFDFWGYSLMAMGLGAMMGFSIPQNFDAPYISKSMTEFWRRWHMTLGRFFREYVYIPLGGNRVGVWKWMRNIVIVWALTGLWHGASWNFVLWGLGFAIFLILEKFIYGKYLNRYPILGHIYVCVLIPVTWMVFEIGDFGQLLIYLKQLIGIHTGEVLVKSAQLFRYLKQFGWLFAICALCSTYLPIRLYKKGRKTLVFKLVCLAIFWLSVYELATSSNNPFLYFRF